MRLQSEVRLSAPPPTVWAYLCDLTNASDHVPYLVSAVPVGDGVLAEGAVARLTFSALGRELAADAVVTEIAPERKLAVRAAEPTFGVVVDVEWTLTPEGEGTLLVQRATAAFGAVLTGLGIEAMARSRVDDAVLADGLARLRTAVESE